MNHRREGYNEKTAKKNPLQDPRMTSRFSQGERHSTVNCDNLFDINSIGVALVSSLQAIAK
jgi:hypothetical protein